MDGLPGVPGEAALLASGIPARLAFNGSFLLLAALALPCLAALALLLRLAAGGIAGRARARREAAALLSGDPLPGGRRARRSRRRGLGLPLKMVSFTTALVLFAVLLVSAPLHAWLTWTRREILFGGLQDRSRVLLEGVSASCRILLPQENVPELARLPDRRVSIPEAGYLTITGAGAGPGIFEDRVWASNDPDILEKIDTPVLVPGVSRLTDPLSPRIGGMVREFGGGPAGGADVFPGGGGVRSEPPFSSGIPEPEGNLFLDLFNFLRTRVPGDDVPVRHIFYLPVPGRDGEGEGRLLGLVRLGVSTEPLLEEIRWRGRDLLRLVAAVAAFAALMGALGASLLSHLIILPIRRLVSHVELIRDTENMAALDGLDLDIKSSGEIALLGNTINDMTRGLVRAAQASRDLTIGKELQKKFIPLDTDREGNKLTTGFRETPGARFFGYYEGAKGVSGDYFDYQDLDGRYFAVIKCDVAGKGVPAALIMIQVATMFLNYFNDWTPDGEGMRIERAVYQINEFIEALGFSGRFAAFSLCLFDSKTGLLRFCNAGDNIVHLYDASERRVRHVYLRETPAAGVLPNFLVDSRGGYTVETARLDHGDMLFLYTDGIEEAKRKFRDGRGAEIRCAETSRVVRGEHGNHRPGQAGEELGRDRVEGIINAVLNRGVYTLRKYHDPEEEDLLFDFRSSRGTVDEAVLALASVEKIFRAYRPRVPGEGPVQGPSGEGGGDARVLVDRKVDEFLRRHFAQYEKYCPRAGDGAENPGYIYYTGISEDPQYDDLTILGIRRK